ncbi:hypothetical protein MLD38_010489 [Melastoma candidum]|uniref:Uncharacterized protein n=1 Tax=Melastoma candidum TaxID=119954 RepID=A0ACB9R141_9MYRT|nr:hypothetical protein MLD38_010489 [Melastoma candidum]
MLLHASFIKSCGVDDEAGGDILGDACGHVGEERPSLVAPLEDPEDHEEIWGQRQDDLRRGPHHLIFFKACELFIKELTRRSWMMTLQGKRRTLHKDDVASAIIATDIFDFLVNLVDDHGLGVVVWSTD